MAAALPYVDQFVEGHALNSLEDLAQVIAGAVPARLSAPPRAFATREKIK
jgi:hypothetical protein